MNCDRYFSKHHNDSLLVSDANFSEGAMDPSYYDESVEEITFFSEGMNGPILEDRSNQLAVECWNLRKTILELNSQILKCRNENKSHKNLIKNLQSLLSSSQSDNQVRSRENSQLKNKLNELEKNLTELKTNFDTVTATSVKQKRFISSLQNRLQENDKTTALKAKDSGQFIELLRQQLKEKEELFAQKLNEKETILKDLSQQNLSLNAVVNHSNLKIEELVKENEQLKQQVSALEAKSGENEASFLRELEKTYEDFQSKVEQLTAEKQEFYRRYLEKEHELTQLKAVIASEAAARKDAEAAKPRRGRYAAGK